MTMKSMTNQTYYADRLARVTAYIHEHLDSELDLNKLADIACLSPHHWHRTYQALQGETAAATVKRLRLHRAAGYLAQSTMPVDTIAEKSGYTSVQAFTRAFNAVFGIPPARYRKEGSHTTFDIHGDANDESALNAHPVAIREVAPLKLWTVAHTGSYMGVGQAFDALYGWLGARNMISPEARSIGVYFDDPTAVEEDKLRSAAGIVVEGLRDAGATPPADSPMAVTNIAGGTYAVLRHIGPYADMRSAYQWMFGVWLVQSGWEAADGPIFEDYINSPRDTAPTELISDIYVPLRERSTK
jgi:AraC family transcriptional regulator